MEQVVGMDSNVTIRFRKGRKASYLLVILLEMSNKIRE